MSGKTIRDRLRVLWLAVLALTPLISAFVPAVQTSNWLKVILAPAYLMWVGKLLYDNWDWFYFRFTRLVLIVTQAEVRWSMSVEMSINDDGSAIETVYHTILSARQDAKPWQDHILEKIIALPRSGGMIRIRSTDVPTGPEDSVTILVLDVSDLVIPFRNSERTLDEIVGILDSVRGELRPSQEKYTFRVNLDGLNPYFGLFVRKLRMPQQQLLHFECDFSEEVGSQKGRVQVNKTRISLTTQSLTTLAALSRRYVTLSALDLTSP